MSRDDWSEDVARMYDAARNKAGLAYGPWQVIEVANAVVTYGGRPGCFKRVDRGYAVADVVGNVITTVQTKEVAELIASLPDLCDPCLRPQGTMSGTVVVSYKDATLEAPSLLGVSEPARLFEYGVDAGYQLGFNVGYDEGTDETGGDNGRED